MFYNFPSQLGSKSAAVYTSFKESKLILQLKKGGGGLIKGALEA